MILEKARRFFDPAHAACLAALLIAIGVEIDSAQISFGLEVAGAVIAIIGFFLRAAPRLAVETPLTEPQNRQRT